MLYLSGTFQACKGLKTASLLSFFLHKDESTSSSQMRFFFTNGGRENKREGTFTLAHKNVEVKKK